MTLDWPEKNDGATGSSDIYGAPDLKKICQMLNGKDVSPTHIQIHGSVPIEFSDGVVRLLNPAKTFYARFKTSAFASNIDITIPLLTTNDTLAFLGIAQTWLANQTIQKSSLPTLTIQGDGSDTNPLIKLYANRTTAANTKTLGKHQILEKISAAEKIYYELEVISDDITGGSEDASAIFKIIEAGTLTELLRLKAGTGVVIPATKKLFLDGGGDSYDQESAANVLDRYVGGTKVQTWEAAQITNQVEHDFVAGIRQGKLRKIFEEFFCGKLLDTTSVWLTNNISGTNTFAIEDGIDSGLKITTGAVTNNSGSITMNNFRNFDPARCTIYGIIQFDNTNNKTIMGLCNSTDMDFATNHIVGIRLNSATTNIELISSDGTTLSASDSGVAKSTANTPFKIVCTSTDIKLYLVTAGQWSLKVTKTTNRPTAACQPCFQVKTSANSAQVGRAIYLRVQSD